LDNSWQLKTGSLRTKWAEAVNPERVWPQYPRPQLVRSQWLNLNGLWDYAIRPLGEAFPNSYDGKILVPFPVESALSGVGRALLPKQELWYRRSFELPSAWSGERVLLHFGAVDWQARIWLNGHFAGEHRGGYCPFSTELTDFLQDGVNELVVAAWDSTGSEGQQRGKQSLKPSFIFYSAVSGIWQTVWLEPVPATYIRGFKLLPDIDRQLLQVLVDLDGPAAEQAKIEALVYDGDLKVTSATARPGEILTLKLKNPKLWSPDSPYLYNLQLELILGKMVDSVKSYFGMRKFSIGSDSEGFKRLLLNNQPFFQHGPLDQGYWPDGLYTAPSEDALLHDLELTKGYGFNMIRKHLKVEMARWYYHCDRLGLIVWQDMPSGGSGLKPFYNLLPPTIFPGKRFSDKRYKMAGRADQENRVFFLSELKEMIDTLMNHPSIGMWVIFNEGWGQFDAAYFLNWLEQYDSSRYIDHASGWFDQGLGEINSRHRYMGSLKEPGDTSKRVFILSEYGGYALPVSGHTWKKDGSFFGQKKFKSRAALNQGLNSLIKEQLKPLVAKGLAGAVYTQLTDVEIELNGLVTYDRDVRKADLVVFNQIKGGFFND
jgi:beta-galactosidase/beta-glucuronidase